MFKPPAPVVIAFVALALVGGGFAAGRYATPDRVEYKDKIVEVEANVDAYVAEINKLQEEVHTLKTTIATAKNVTTKKVIKKAPDGTVTTTIDTVDTSKIDKTVDEKDSKKEQETKVEIRVVEKLVYKDHETLKIIERNRPAWALSLMPGFDFAGAFGHGTPVNLIPNSLLPTSIPGLRHIVIGTSIERRIIGPFSGGIWANTAGMGGLVLRLEF